MPTILVLPARLERRDVGADSRYLRPDPAVAHGLELRAERFVSQQLTVGHRPLWSTLHRHDALGYGQVLHRRFQPLRGQTEKHTTRLGGGHARFCSADRGGPAGRCEAVRAHKGVVSNNRHLTEFEIELLRGNLTERSRAALPEIDVAEVNRRGIVWMDCDVGIDRCRIRGTRLHATLPGPRAPRRSLGRGCVCDPDAHHHDPSGLQKIPTRQNRRVVSGVMVGIALVGLTHGSPVRLRPKTHLAGLPSPSKRVESPRVLFFSTSPHVCAKRDGTATRSGVQ